MLLTRTLLAIVLGFSSSNAAANLARRGNAPPQSCTDGGQRRYCAAIFNGKTAPVDLLSALACYDVTPADTNCILTEDPAKCPGGTWQCCQIVLDPVLGMYCGPPPGPCQGPEKSQRCLDIANGRFGKCTASSPLKGLLDPEGKYPPGSGKFRYTGPGGLDLNGLLPGLGSLVGGGGCGK